MRLYLVNPDNPVVSLKNVRWNRLNKYRVWKPLGLLVVAGLTPPAWEVTLIDENLGHPDYGRLPKPDLVGITAFTSQAPRAYEVAAMYRAMGVPVVIGGIHATFCRDEALDHAEAVVTGEAESVWAQVSADAQNHALRRVYEGGIAGMDAIPTARHDLLSAQYHFGSVRAMIREGLTRPWICQATINFADDEELLDLAARSGCQGVFVGFESPTAEGLMAVGKKFNLQKRRNFRASVHRIQRHGMCVVGSFIVGIDPDHRGIGEAIARAAREYGVDAANVLILTPLPGTKLYAEMEREGRIRSNSYPEDWRYYTLTCPVADYKHLTWEEVVEEVNRFNARFYSYLQIVRRMVHLAGNTRSLKTFLVTLVANLSYRSNHLLDQRAYASRVLSLSLGDTAATAAANAAFPVTETPLALAGQRSRAT